MKSKVILIAALAISSALLQPGFSQEKQEKKAEEMQLKISGVYTAWFQKQQDFFFGKTNYNDNYVVQMLRLQAAFAMSDNLKAVTRFDLAQGWWGVDNDDYRSDAQGTVSSRFSNKDTNYSLHVDIGYLDFMVPGSKFPVNFRVGRMYYGLGNKIVLDSNLDGIQVDLKPELGNLGFGWARVSEGLNNAPLSDNEAAPTGDGGDANLFYGKFGRKSGNLSYELFGMYYKDAGDATQSFIPNGIDYGKTRFSPNISSLTTLGLTMDYVNKAKGLQVKTEFNFLTGADDIDNQTSGAAQILDVNDGDLSGYNVYVKANKDVNPKVKIGLTAGMGSGDDDLTGGGGNVNKLKTMGFFYITELWEDSIMPDEEGISPQGLGAPNTRGYRELENTTLIQGNIQFKPIPKLKLYAAYTFLNATNAIHAWAPLPDDETTTIIDPNVSAKDLGSELDFKIDYSLYKQLVWSLRGGYLFAGDAAQLLINGNTQNSQNPWELKMVITYKFK